MGRVASLPPTHTGVAGAPYDAHLAAVFGLARRVTGSSRTAAEVTRDVFAQLHDLDGEPSDTLATCLLTETHRRSVARVRGARLGDDGGLTSPAPDAVLAVLPPAERDVIADAFFGGWTYDEIAARRGLAPAEVVRLLGRGLQQLRDAGAEAPVDQRSDAAGRRSAAGR